MSTVSAPVLYAPPALPRGTTLRCRSWLTEAPYRMLLNNLVVGILPIVIGFAAMIAIIQFQMEDR